MYQSGLSREKETIGGVCVSRLVFGCSVKQVSTLAFPSWHKKLDHTAFLRLEYLHKLCGILLHKRFVRSPLIYSYQYGLVIFILELGYNPMLLLLLLLLLFCCTDYSSFGHWQLFQLASVSLWLTLIIVVFFCLVGFLSPCLTSGSTIHSRLICMFPTKT